MITQGPHGVPGLAPDRRLWARAGGRCLGRVGCRTTGSACV